MTAEMIVRRRGKRLGHRSLFSATVRLGAAVDAAEVKLARGAHKIATDHEGATVSTAYEAGARLWAEIGDRLLLAPVDLEDDRIAVVEVARVCPDGSTLEVFRTCGEMAPGPVFIMRGPKPRDTRPVIRRAVVREAERPGQALADLVRAKRLEIANDLGVLRTARETSGERGGGPR